MRICIGGDIHGALDRFYSGVLSFEATLTIRFDWLLHVGDFGIWPDPSRVNRATRNHDGAGDFPAWVSEKRGAPRRTVFIKGNHEDFDWLDDRHDREILPNLIHLPNGRTIDLENGSARPVRVAGVGGCYSPSDYERPSRKLQGYAKRHYTQDEIERLKCADGVDIVLTHDAPAGVTFPGHRHGRGYVSHAAGLDKLLAYVRPQVAFFGHHYTRVDAEISGVRCIGLNKVGMPGNLMAIEIAHGQREWTLLGESGKQ